MSKEDLLKQKNLVVFNGVIAEILPNRICKVKITDETTKAERVVICYVAGKFEEKEKTLKAYSSERHFAFLLKHKNPAGPASGFPEIEPRTILCFCLLKLEEKA